ncbi:MAG: hypothetical protein ACLQQ0_00195 [Limisphaerales bacterium]
MAIQKQAPESFSTLNVAAKTTSTAMASLSMAWDFIFLVPPPLGFGRNSGLRHRMADVGSVVD